MKTNPNNIPYSEIPEYFRSKTYFKMLDDLFIPSDISFADIDICKQLLYFNQAILTCPKPIYALDIQKGTPIIYPITREVLNYYGVSIEQFLNDADTRLTVVF